MTQLHITKNTKDPKYTEVSLDSGEFLIVYEATIKEDGKLKLVIDSGSYGVDFVPSHEKFLVPRKVVLYGAEFKDRGYGCLTFRLSPILLPECGLFDENGGRIDFVGFSIYQKHQNIILEVLLPETAFTYKEI